MDLKIKSVQFQRNGICGEPFHAVWFSFTDKGREENLIATLTDHKYGCLIIDPLVPESHWRGDHFERDLREAIVHWYSERFSISTLEYARAELNDRLTEKVY